LHVFQHLDAIQKKSSILSVSWLSVRKIGLPRMNPYS
jgi:hypothetical protein